MRILIVKLSSLGDIIHTLPCVYALRQAYPLAKLDWVTEEVGQELLEGHPDINRLIVYKRNQWAKDFKEGQILKVFKEWLEFKQRLQYHHYDLIFDFQGLLKSGLIVGMARGRYKIGFKNGREGSHHFLNQAYQANFDDHAVIRYLKLLEFAGIKVNYEDVEFPLMESPCKLPPRPYVMLNPMARWPSKLWFLEKWIAVAKGLKEMGLTPVVTGSRKDWSYAQAICQGCKRAINLAGQTQLKQLVFLYQRAVLTISVDTGTMHLAAAAGCPVIALFGPTAPWRTGPFGSKHIILFKGLSCQPCLRKRCADKVCLERISPEEVLTAAKQLLDKV